jgi:hypothetical protein
MSTEQMGVRCPGGKLLGQGSLADHEFRINERGVATVSPKKGSVVFGVLWEITTPDEEALDRYEGVQKGVYSKNQMEVQCNGAGAVALIYVATNAQPGVPRPGYLEKVIAAAKERRIPIEYLAALEHLLKIDFETPTAVNREIQQLWDKYYPNGKDDPYWPLVYGPIQTETLLFVGINPSFTTELDNCLRRTQRDVVPCEEFYSRTGNAFDLGKAVVREQCYRAKEKPYPYFRRFYEIAGELQIESWEHIDVFFNRNKDQDYIKNELIDSREPLKRQCALQQMELSLKLIGAAKPKLVIVCNALASEIIGETYHLEFDDQSGIWLWQLNGTVVPTFLSGMLSGGTLDRWSYKRLKWHVKQVWNSKTI